MSRTIFLSPRHIERCAVNILCFNQSHCILNSIHSIFKRVKTLEEITYGRPREIFNANRMLGNFVEHAYSPDGEYCAFTISSEIQNLHKLIVVHVRSGRTYGKCLQLFTCKKIAWSGDSMGFFIYVRVFVGFITRFFELVLLPKISFLLDKC